MTRHIVIPDVQIRPGDDLSFLRCISNYIVDKKPDIIVCLGDFADMSSLSLYDVGKKSFEGRTYKDDVDAALEGMTSLSWGIHQERLKLEQGKRKRWNPRMVLTLGNHEARIDKAINNDRKLDGLISIEDLDYESFGWEVSPFLQPVVIDGIAYCHYMCSGVMGKPITTARAILTKKHMSVIVGHQQGRDVAYSHKADGRQMTAIIAGSCYEHEEHYLNAQTNNHWRGILMLNEVSEGSFDECFISLNYLKRKYDN